MTKLLVLDIETAPALAYVWRLHDENVGLEQLLEPSQILSVGWKWVGQRKFHYEDVWPINSASGRSKMLAKIHAAISASDGLISFNGSSFDLPKLNGAFLVANLPPVPPVAHIDVYLTTRKMGFTSGKLAHVAPLLGCGNKLPSGGFILWREYMAGDAAARAKMKKYNEQDVRVLERLYNRILPYITNHAHIGNRGECPNCGNSNLQHRGYRYTRKYKVERLQCVGPRGCGSWPDGKRSAK